MNEVRHLVARAVLYGVLVSVALGVPACQCDSGGSSAEVSEAGDGERPGADGATTGGGNGGARTIDEEAPEPDPEVFAEGVQPGGAAFEVESEGYTGRVFIGSLQVIGDAESPGHVARFGPGAAHAPLTVED